MFDNYPKTRQALPNEYANIYEKHIKMNREGETAVTSISMRIEKWLHKMVAEDSATRLSTLEIGAGTLNQLQYEHVSSVYDIVEPSKMLYENSVIKNKIRNIYEFIEDVPITNKYDRITSCAVFEHIENLPYVVAKTGLIVGEVLRVAIPNEGGALWTLAYKMTTGVEFWIKHKLDYSIIMKYEHINTVNEIEDIIKWFYKNVSVKRFGWGKHLSLYTYFEARNPDIDLCEKYYYMQ